MRKKQDIMWEQSTLWESVEKWVTKYLKKNHSEYRELQVKAMRIVEENPTLRKKPRGQEKWFFYCPFGVLDFQELNICCCSYIYFFCFYTIIACKPRMRT